MINSTEVVGYISSAYQVALGHAANAVEIAAGQSELLSGASAGTLQQELGELSGGPSPGFGGNNISISNVLSQIIGGSSPSFIYSLLNNDALISAGPDTVNESYLGSHSYAMIQNFSLNTDVLQIQTKQDAGFSNLQFSAFGSIGTSVDLGGGAEILLVNTPYGSLHPSNFRFV